MRDTDVISAATRNKTKRKCVDKREIVSTSVTTWNFSVLTLCFLHGSMGLWIWWHYSHEDYSNCCEEKSKQLSKTNKHYKIVIIIRRVKATICLSNFYFHTSHPVWVTSNLITRLCCNIKYHGLSMFSNYLCLFSSSSEQIKVSILYPKRPNRNLTL